MTDRSDYNAWPWRMGLVLIVLALVAFPFDGPISDAAAHIRARLGGDLRRELEAWQQYGQFGWVLVTAIAFALLQPWRSRRLLDLALAMALTWGLVQSIKLFVGRPRPKFHDPGILLGPFGSYPVSPEAGVRHAWEFWAPISSDLWSMPSSHTAYAAMLSVFIATTQPRLRYLVAVLTVLVGLCRVLFGAHYLSDVFVGAAAGFLCSRLVIRNGWGVGCLDWLWKRFIDLDAEPALPRLLAAENERLPGR